MNVNLKTHRSIIMQAVKNTSLLLAVLGLFWFAPGQQAQAQQVGTCQTGNASADLNVNNVRARLFNFGGLFWRGGDPIYRVPKGAGASQNSVFAHGIWIGGQVNDELRMAAATYSGFEFWPGPLDEQGNPPANCSNFDRIYCVTANDIASFEQGNEPAADLADWPVDLGAPVVDGDGNPNNYNLSGGDRPDLTGDQTCFWVMNDRGGQHATTNTPPIGLEVQVTAFAFRSADALNNTTFYRYKLVYEGNDPLEDAYFGIWVDPDLGDATDDFVGSDTSRGLGYVYNGDAPDANYGTPPALGFDYFQGPLVDSDGRDNNDNGEVDEEGERIQMSKFVYYNNDNTNQGNPDNAQEYYGYLRGVWRDGSPITLGGTGIGGDTPTDYMFPGDPVAGEFWSEENIDGTGARNAPADRRFLMSSGPFSIQPGETQEIVYGIVWSQSVNRLASVAKLLQDDVLAQGAFDSDFDIPAPPSAPVVCERTEINEEGAPEYCDEESDVTVSELDDNVVVSWENPPSVGGQNNYLNSYNLESPFLISPNPEDGNTTYTFEGYRVFQYESPSDTEGDLIATFDRKNNITRITDEQLDPETGALVTQVVAQGGDNGVQNFINLSNYLDLTNYTKYYIGVQAYAYNPNSSPKVYASPVTRTTIMPSNPASQRGGTDSLVTPESAIASNRIAGTGNAGGVFAEVANPQSVTGDEYQVQVYDLIDRLDQDFAVIDGDTVQQAITYDIVNQSDDEAVELSGEQFYKENGELPPLSEDVVTIDGLSFSVQSAEPGFDGRGNGIAETAWAGSAVSPPDVVWHSLNSTADYYVTASGTGDLSRLQRYIDDAVPRDFEMRFTEDGGYAVYAFSEAQKTIAKVPFEIWDTGIATPDDESDDRRMIPFLLSPSDASPASQFRFDAGITPLFEDPGSDIVYWMNPSQEVDNAYQKFADRAESAGGAGAAYPVRDVRDLYYADFSEGFVYPIGRFMFGDFAEDGTPPPAGTTIRIETTKPLAEGDVFSINTRSSRPAFQQDSVATTNVDNIGIVPNPYRGASEYEVSSQEERARFTNLPERATIRIYTLDGTLVNTLQKDGPGATLDWNLENQDGLSIASGIYLVHVTAFEDGNEIGQKVLKFAVVRKQRKLNIF